MLKKIPLVALMLCSVAALAAAPAKKPASVKLAPEPVEIALAHNMGGEASAELEKLVQRFNAISKDGSVRLLRQTPGMAPAPLNLLRRIEVAEFVAAKGSFKPLHALLRETKTTAAVNLSPNLKAGVADERGRLLALPIAYSTPVFYYNKNAFRKAGLDPELPPQTWSEVQGAAGKLAAAGVSCPYTTSWPTWIHVDNLSALSSAAVANAKGELIFNGLVQVKHIAKLSTWQRARYFHVFGRRNEADQHFRNGECAMLTSDSAAAVEFRDAPGVEIGVAPLPYHDDVYGGRQNTLADGASLWIGGGYKKPEYRLAARFVEYLLTPAVQVQLVQAYGLLPLTDAGRLAAKSEILRSEDRALEIALASMKGSGHAQPLRISAIDPVRIIVDEELEKVWSEQLPPKAALDNATQRGNAFLSAKPALRRAQPF